MKGFFQAPWRFAACYAAFLIAAFTWALLDTFVIPHRELIVSRARDVADEVLETLAPSATLAAPQAADASFYQDESMSVQLTTLRRDGTTCYVADVRLASPALLRTALAENTFGRNVTDTVSELAGANGAVLAINGDFYGSRKSGWCLRNGVLYRGTSASSPTELLLVDASGDFSIADDRTMTAGDAEGLWQIFQLVEKARLRRSFPTERVSPALSARPGKRAGKPCYARLPNPPHMSLDSDFTRRAAALRTSQKDFLTA